MSFATLIAIALLGGVALGFVYFSLLHWSVRRVLQSNGGSFTMAAALLCRLALAATVFLLAIQNGGWPTALATLAGFLLVRTAVTWRRRGESLERYS